MTHFCFLLFLQTIKKEMCGKVIFLENVLLWHSCLMIVLPILQKKWRSSSGKMAWYVAPLVDACISSIVVWYHVCTHVNIVSSFLLNVVIKECLIPITYTFFLYSCIMNRVSTSFWHFFSFQDLNLKKLLKCMYLEDTKKNIGFCQGSTDARLHVLML